MSYYYTVNSNTTLLAVNTSNAPNEQKNVVLYPNSMTPAAVAEGRLLYLKEAYGSNSLINSFNVVTNFCTIYPSTTLFTVSSLACLTLQEYPSTIYNIINLYGGKTVFSTMEAPSPTSVAVNIPPTTSAVFVDLQTQSKTVILPELNTLTTNTSQSPLFTIKDRYGNASVNPLFLSTSGYLETIDGLGNSIAIRDNNAVIEVMGDYSKNRWHILNYFNGLV